MQNEKIKNVLVTTLSTLPDKNLINYYFGGGQKKFICNGISSLEAGSKYILSTVSIDKIVVIGSNETHYDSDNVTEPVNLLTLKTATPAEIKNLSPYGFYKQRIAAFLQNNSCLDIYASNGELQEHSYHIETQRQEEIKVLVYKALKSHCPSEKISAYLSGIFYDNQNPDIPFQSISNCIRKDLEQDIDNSFKENLATKYLNNPRIDALKEKYANVIHLDTDRISENERKKIEQDTSLSFWERQYLYTELKRKIEKILYEQQQYHTQLRETQITHGLYQEIQILDKHLEEIKSKRKISEFNYAKYIIYTMISPADKLLARPENSISNQNPTQELPICFVNESTDNTDNLNGMVRAIQEENTAINLYIDMQGGNRTSGYVRNAVLSILTNQADSQISIAKIVATNYNHKHWMNEIVDETKRYKILDLAAGMNAFIRYGKADIMQNYCDSVDMPHDSKFRKLVNHMISIDNALSLCNIKDLTTAINDLSIFINTESTLDNDSNIFQVLSDGIRRDYGGLLKSNELNYIDLIEWSVKKGFIQQALTLIEDKMPKVYFHQQWLSYSLPDNDSHNKLVTYLGEKYQTRPENLLFYKLYGEYFRQKTLPIKVQLWKHFKKSSTPFPINNHNRHDYSDSNITLKDFVYQVKKDSCNYILKNDIEQQNIRIKEFLESNYNAEAALPHFVFLYCKLRALERYRQQVQGKEKKHETNTESYRMDFGQAYDIIKTLDPDELFYRLECDYTKNYTRKDPSISFTILSCLGEHEYILNRKKEPIPLNISIHVHNKLDPICYPDNFQKLEELFLLHDALKKERNCNNHAAENCIRLSKNVVASAIKLYITKCKEIQRLIQ